MIGRTFICLGISSLFVSLTVGPIEMYLRNPSKAETGMGYVTWHDIKPFDNYNTCCSLLFARLASETDIKSFQTKLREAEKANDELAAKLAKKERECEIRVEEKVN